MSEENKINWKKSNFLQSKKGELIVVNIPCRTDDETYFQGCIINAEKSETNTVLTHSTTFKKSKFEVVNPSDIMVGKVF